MPIDIARKPKGIRKIVDKNGRFTAWQAYVRIGGKLHTRCFPPHTALTIMRQWRENERVRTRLGIDESAHGRALVDDVADYLDMIPTLATFKWRKADLTIWLGAFGPTRIRKSITAGEIRAQLEKWRKEGYAPSTVNHCRTALMSLWTTLDGKSATNPARDVPRFPEDQGPPRSLSLGAVAAVLDKMPPSPTRARIELMRRTGWPHAQIARLEPGDIRWDDAVYVKPRRKGKGAAGVWLPLLPEAWTALREFKRLGCWGSFSTSSMRKSFRLAAGKVAADKEIPELIRAELANVTPYQLRHSFLTLVASITQDDRAVMVLAQHADIRQTHRYTQATADPRAAAALQEVAKRLQNGPKTA
jgi:integrase